MRLHKLLSLWCYMVVFLLRMGWRERQTPSDINFGLINCNDQPAQVWRYWQWNVYTPAPKCSCKKTIYFQEMPTVQITIAKIIQQKYAFATFEAPNEIHGERFSQGSIKIKDKQTKEDLRVSGYLKGYQHFCTNKPSLLEGQLKLVTQLGCWKGLHCVMDRIRMGRVSPT